MISNYEKNVLTLDEVSEYAGLSKSYVYKLTASRMIPHYKPRGKLLFFKKQELDEWLLSGRVTPVNETEQAAYEYIMNQKLRGR